MRTFLVLCVVGLGFLLLPWGGRAQPAGDIDISQQKGGMEVLVQGAVHEAFAQPTLRRQGAAMIVTKQPPEPVPELPAEQKPEGENVIWIPGYWQWDADTENYLWVSGIWRQPPPGYQWVPGYWEQTEGGSRWVSGYWSGESQPEVLPQPPDPVDEAIPAAPDEASAYIPGTWVHRQTRYLWRPGYWVRYRPGWTWVPASYVWTPAGYVFNDGYWDYELARRGLLFAPASFNPSWYRRPGWYYRPSYVVLADSLLNNLFIGLRGNHYYFGNYYDPRFVNLGFHPWGTWMSGHRYYDPLYGYARWQHRATPRWEEEMRIRVVAHQKGTLPPPPRTLVQLQKLGPKSTSVLVVTPLVKLSEHGGVKLTPVPKAQLVEIRKSAENLHALSQKRRQLENALVVGKAPIHTGTPTKITLNVNIDNRTKIVVGEKGPPPRPELPKVVVRPPEKGGTEKNPPIKLPPDKGFKEKKPPEKKIPPKKISLESLERINGETRPVVRVERPIHAETKQIERPSAEPRERPAQPRVEHRSPGRQERPSPDRHPSKKETG